MKPFPIVWSVIFTICGHTVGPIDAAESKQPNIVLLISDDDDYEHFGFMGNERVETPTLDSLVAAGTLFTHAHCPASLCRPSLASILSGRMPHQHGIYANYLEEKGIGNDSVKLDPTDSLANQLKAAGYATYATAKYWEGDPREMGFTHGTVDVTFQGFGRFVREGQEELNEFIDTQHDQPMFIWWAPLLPHTPHNPPPEYADRFADTQILIPDYYAGDEQQYVAAMRNFYAMGSWFDDGVAQLIQKLKDVGEYENTLFLFYVDNGWTLGQPAKNSPNEKGLRTPMFVTWPDHVPAGRRIEGLNSALDLHATILDYAGLELPKDIASETLRPLIEGQSDKSREALYGAVYAHAPANYAGDPTISHSAERDVYALYVRTDRWKYVLYTQDIGPHNDRYIWIVHQLCDTLTRSQGEENLFDLDVDPYESNDLADRPEQHERLAEFRTAVLDWWHRTGGGPLAVESVLQSRVSSPAEPAATKADAGVVSMESLLSEMIDRDGVAKFPTADFRLRQASSYDRNSKTPDDPEGWFANVDRINNFVRIEENDGRQEWVIMEHDAPGAIVRSWMPDKRISSDGKTSVNTRIRIYLDGNDEPAIEGHMLDLFNGTGLAPYPLAHKSHASAVSFLPIPYAKSCKITLDEPPFYYIFTHREYPAGTPIRTFTMDDFQAVGPMIEHVGQALLNPTNATEGNRILIDAQIAPQAEVSAGLPPGVAAVRGLSLKLGSNVAPQVTRSLVLKIEFDGRPTVWCPIGDFFGSGVGLNPFKGWWRTVGRDGSMRCRWVMPYRTSGKISLINLSTRPVPARLETTVGAWTWDERSMVFHTDWRHQDPVPTRPFSDFNYVTLTGRGVFVGDTLTVMNPVAKWWGEGDAKIWVDGESFPSIFGTGTEDYYGYSWGGQHTMFYEHPFHAQPRAHRYNQFTPKTDLTDRNTSGYSTETRTRALDTMPFGESLQVDMEVWHWEECEMAYSVATHWYGLDETKTNRAADPTAAAALVNPITVAASPGRRRQEAPPEPDEKVPGAIEFEDLDPIGCSEGVELLQRRVAPLRWSGGMQMRAASAAAADFVEFAIPAADAGAKRLLLHATRGPTYRKCRISVQGTPIRGDFDFHAEDFAKTGPIDLGLYEPENGRFVLRFETIDAIGPDDKRRLFVGMDCIVLEKP